MAEQLAEPLQPSSYGQRFLRALHEAKAGSLDPKPSLRMSSNSSWATRSRSKRVTLLQEVLSTLCGTGRLFHVQHNGANLVSPGCR